MEKFNAKRVINGTFGTVWLNGVRVAECYKCSAKETYTREEVAMCGSLKSGKKLTKVEGTGSIGLYKVNSRMALIIGEKVKNGEDPHFTLISKLADPDAYGAERISFMGVTFDDLTLVDWEAGVLGKVEAPFSFEDYELLDKIEAGV